MVDAYEAGKLINILLQRDGGSIAFSELGSLHHVGGLSLLAYRQHVGDGYVKIDESGVTFQNDFKEEFRPWIPRKRLTCHYVSQQLAAMVRGETSGGDLLVEEPEVRERVLDTVARMRILIDADRALFERLDRRHWASRAWGAWDAIRRRR